jgi:hypothetical protein
MEELQRGFTEAKYVAVMELAQQYAECVYDCSHHSKVIMFLLLAAWESLSRYLALQYQQAHRYYLTLRRRWEQQHAKLTRPEIEHALKHKVDLAEQCCSAQKGYLLTQAWQRRVNCSLQ